MKKLNRNDIEEKYKWDLTKFCASDEAFYVELERLKSELPKIVNYKGKLGDKKNLREFYNVLNDFNSRLENLAMYSSNHLNEDLGNANYIEMDGMLDNFCNDVSEKLSFYAPEMLGYNDTYLQGLITDPDFSDKDFSITKLLRQKKHTLSEAEEKLLSKLGLFTGSFSEILNTYMSVDLKCPPAIDQDGNEHLLNTATYGNILSSNDRTLREDAFKKMSQAVKNVNTTISKNFIASIKKDAYFANVFHYEDSLQEKLYADNMTKDVYDNLVKNAHKRLDIVARYHDAKRRKLGYQKLQPWDRLCSMASDNNEKFTFEKSCDILRQALAPLGQDYLDTFEQAIRDRWFDVYPTEGKRGGAYENAIYGRTPVILLNHTDDYSSVSTMAHEFGHAMHSHYADKAQCRSKASYSIFCAEIASTTNEVLLNEYFLKQELSDKERLFYLDDLINTFQSTFFRQTMFAEFERFAHDLVDYGKPVSHKVLNDKYAQLNLQYLPNVEENELSQYEWTRIPHFYSKFYVWQYATGIVCAINFASSILNNEPNALENYKNFLSSGGKAFSLEILKECGIDLTTDKPYQVAFDFIDSRLKEIEKITFKDKCNEFTNGK